MGDLSRLCRISKEHTLQDDLSQREACDLKTEKVLANSGILKPKIEDYTQETREQYFKDLNEYESKKGFYYVEMINKREKSGKL